VATCLLDLPAFRAQNCEGDISPQLFRDPGIPNHF
jgi:hypothetical protein